MNNLKKFGLTIENICATEVTKIKELIFEINFNNNKA